MHIPDNYLIPQTVALMIAIMVPVWGVSIHKVRKQMTQESVSKIGIGGAYSFIGMMFNIPIPGGTTGHAVGGTLIAATLGPHAACLAVTVALLLQALIFGDGGILAFGANCFNMAFVMPFVGYYISKLVRKLLKFKAGDIVSVAIGSYFGINAASLMAAIEFGVQPYLFKDAAGQAMYCPYGLNVSIPAMMIAHLTVAGLAEVIYTVLVYSFLKKASNQKFYLEKDFSRSAKEIGDDSVKEKKDFSWILLLVLMILTPLGLLAEGTAWGEWGADEIAATGVGFTPKGMTEGINFEAMIPDYSMAGLPDIAAYILSAIIGVALTVVIFKLISLTHKKRVEE